MAPLPKCLLFPIDGTEEALRPVEFLRRLYPNPDQVGVILCYFAPALPPAYREQRGSPEQLKKKQEFMKSREQETRAALDQAKKALVSSGISGRHDSGTCPGKAGGKSERRLPSGRLEKSGCRFDPETGYQYPGGLFEDDPTHDLLRHCLASPLWLVEGTVDVSHAAICITNEEASLRAADHAAFMLTGTGTEVTLLHAANTISHPVSTPAAHITAEVEKWLMTPEGRPVKPFLHQAHDILKREGIGDERVRITVIPSQGKAALEIPAFCQKERIGIVVLGHTPPKGVTGFLKGSVTKKIIAELKNMAVWVNQ